MQHISWADMLELVRGKIVAVGDENIQIEPNTEKSSATVIEALRREMEEKCEDDFDDDDDLDEDELDDEDDDLDDDEDDEDLDDEDDEDDDEEEEVTPRRKKK